MRPDLEILIRKVLARITDPTKLLRLRQVSKEWGDIIEEMFERDNLWKVLCSNDHVYPWVYHIAELLFQDRIRDWSRQLLPSAWKKIYLFYNQWSSIITSTNPYYAFSNFEEHTPFKENVFSVDVLNDKIAINIEQTKVVLLEGDDTESEPSTASAEFQRTLLYKASFRWRINRIKLWFTETGKWILIVHIFKKTSESKKLIYIDVDTGKELRNPFKNQKHIHSFTCASHRLFIATSELLYECKYTESNGLGLGQHIFEFQDILNGGEMKQLQVLEMSGKSDFNGVKLSLLMKTAADTVRVVNFLVSYNESTFSLLGCDRSIRIRSFESIFNIPMPGLVLISSETEMIINLWYDLTETHIKANDDWERIVPLAAPKVFDVSRQSGRQSIVSADDDESFPLLSQMIGLEPMKITSITFFCNILFLGLQSGVINMYIADSIKTLIRQDFYKLPTRKLQVSKYPIIAINVVEGNGTFYIVATTPKGIYVNQVVDDVESS